MLDHIKDLYILEFLNVPEYMTGRETDLETAIINKWKCISECLTH